MEEYQIKLLEHEELVFRYTKFEICLQEKLIDTIKKITAICDGDLLVEIDDNNCILFYKVEEADIAQEISIWPAIRIRLEDSLISFREKLAEVEVIIAQNKKLSKIKYCKVKHINVDDDYIIADIYVKGTVEVA